MALSSGDKLGPCEVVFLRGKGGMGEVYLARDAKLNRDVDIKVLPAARMQLPRTVEMGLAGNTILTPAASRALRRRQAK